MTTSDATSAPTEQNGRVAHPTNPQLAGRKLLRQPTEEGMEPPEELEEGILLRGKVHQVFAASGLGKTMLAIWFL